MLKSKIADKILGKVKVKVYKKVEDDRTSLCGEPLQIDEQGRKYFEIPAHQADYIASVFPHYEMGDEYIPSEENIDNREVKKK